MHTAGTVMGTDQGHGLEDTPRKGSILDQDWDTTEIQPEIYDYILYTVL